MDVTRTRGGDIVIIDPNLALIPEIEERLRGQRVDESRIWRLSKETWEKVRDLFSDVEIRKVEIGSKKFTDNIRPMLSNF